MLRIIFKHIIVLAIMFLVLWSFIGCFGYGKPNTLYYYDNITTAMDDVNNNVIGKHSTPTGNISVMKNDDGTFVELTNNVELQTQLRIANAIINLNDFEISSNGFNIVTSGNVEIKNGKIDIKGKDIALHGIVIGRSSVCTIDNVSVTTVCNNTDNLAILAYGKLFLTNSTVCAKNIEDTNSRVTGVYGNLFSNINIDNCDIQASASFGRVYGVYIGDAGEISDTTIVALSNYDASKTKYTSLAIGCMTEGPTTITNCDIYGIHSGINSTSNLNINGGTYSGYGHGGIYFSGCNKTSYVKNAIIQEADFKDGYQTLGPQSTHGGCYIGGGVGQSNNTIFIDNCMLIGQKYGIVLRGTDDEKNNILYISNSTLNKNFVRIDNETHKLFIGSGCNIDTSNIAFKDVVTITEDIYN